MRREFPVRPNRLTSSCRAVGRSTGRFRDDRDDLLYVQNEPGVAVFLIDPVAVLGLFARELPAELCAQALRHGRRRVHFERRAVLEQNRNKVIVSPLQNTRRKILAAAGEVKRALGVWAGCMRWA